MRARDTDLRRIAAGAIDGAMPMPPANRLERPITKFELMTEQLLTAAGSNNRAGRRGEVEKAIRMIVADEVYQGEDNIAKALKEMAAERAICEFINDYQLYRRFRSPYQPIWVSASVADAIVDELSRIGYSVNGRNGGGQARGSLERALGVDRPAV